MEMFVYRRRSGPGSCVPDKEDPPQRKDPMLPCIFAGLRLGLDSISTVGLVMSMAINICPGKTLLQWRTLPGIVSEELTTPVSRQWDIRTVHPPA